MGSDRRKNYGCGQKKQKALALLYLEWNHCRKLWTQAICQLSSLEVISSRFPVRSFDDVSSSHRLRLVSIFLLLELWLITFRFTKCFRFAAENNKNEVLEVLRTNLRQICFKRGRCRFQLLLIWHLPAIFLFIVKASSSFGKFTCIFSCHKTSCLRLSPTPPSLKGKRLRQPTPRGYGLYG